MARQALAGRLLFGVYLPFSPAIQRLRASMKL